MKTIHKHTPSTLVFAGLSLLAAVATAAAQSEVPVLVNYQAYVTDVAGDPLADAGSPENFDVVFRIYGVATGGTPLYSEQQTVTIFNGNLNTLLGQGSAYEAEPQPGLDTVFDGEERFLGITIDELGGDFSDDGEVSPRQQIVATPFAFRSKIAETAFTLGSPDGAAMDTVEVDALGHVGIGTAPAALFHVSGGDDGDAEFILAADADNAGSEDDNPRLILRQDGTAVNAIIGLEGSDSLTIPGSTGNSLLLGTNYTSDVHLFANDQIGLTVESGTGFVGLGTTDPDRPLALQASGISGLGTSGEQWFSLKNDAGATKWHLKHTNEGINFAQTGSADGRLFLEPGGNVGIGTIDPGYLLHITSGTSGDADLLLEADTDNNNESDNPHIRFSQDNGGITALIGLEGSATETVSGSTSNSLLVGADDDINVHLFASNTVGLTVENTTAHIGIGTTSPQTHFHVVGSHDGDGLDPVDNVAYFHNTSTGGSADVLLLQIGTTGNPGGGTNFITFKDGDNQSLGAIQGNGSGGVTNASSGSDYAEYLPKLNPTESIKPGEVVGIFAGEVSKRTGGAERAMVVTTAPNVLGNDPGEGNRGPFAKIAFLGQAPVRVRGPVATGDFLVPSGLEDGTARAVQPKLLDIDSYAEVIGRAWEGSDDPGDKTVNAVIGLNVEGGAMAAKVAQTVRDLAEENGRLRADLARLAEDNRGLATRVRSAEDSIRRMETFLANYPRSFEGAEVARQASEGSERRK